MVVKINEAVKKYKELEEKIILSEISKIDTMLTKEDNIQSLLDGNIIKIQIDQEKNHRIRLEIVKRYQEKNKEYVINIEKPEISSLGYKITFRKK